MVLLQIFANSSKLSIFVIKAHYDKPLDKYFFIIPFFLCVQNDRLNSSVLNISLNILSLMTNILFYIQGVNQYE